MLYRHVSMNPRNSILKMKKPRFEKLGKLALSCIKSWRAIQVWVMFSSHLGKCPGPGLSVLLQSLHSTWLGTRAWWGSSLSSDWHILLTKRKEKLIPLLSISWRPRNPVSPNHTFRYLFSCLFPRPQCSLDHNSDLKWVLYTKAWEECVTCRPRGS